MPKRPLQNNICIVCIDDICDKTTGSVLTTCGHMYCVSCFAQHMRLDNKCAYCRKELVCSLPKKIEVTSDQRNDLGQSIIETLQRDGYITTIITNIVREITTSVLRQHGDDTTITLSMFFKELKAVRLDFDIRRIINLAVDTTCDWFVPNLWEGERDTSG
jgi:hypothetical protein